MTATVARWHSNPDPRLRNSGDDIDRHQRATLSLCLSLAAAIAHPLHNSDLPKAARNHDEAERILGDMPSPGKRRFWWLHMAYRLAEWLVLLSMGHRWKLTRKEKRMLALCDRLDAYLWATDHCGVTGKEWDDALAWCRRIARRIDPRAFDWMERQTYKEGAAA